MRWVLMARAVEPLAAFMAGALVRSGFYEHGWLAFALVSEGVAFLGMGAMLVQLRRRP